MDELTPDMEMSSKEAAAYLSGPVGYTLSADFLRKLRYVGRGPLVEKRGARLVYRKATLDAFLLEHGTDPVAWYAGIWRELAEEIREVSAATGMGGFEPLIETLEKRDPEDWQQPIHGRYVGLAFCGGPIAGSFRSQGARSRRSPI